PNGLSGGVSSSSRRTWIEIWAPAQRAAYRGPSSSSRRTWIEISGAAYRFIYSRSSSSRRTWIEIGGLPPSSCRAAVVLLAEDVDRNEQLDLLRDGQQGRPPRGGRG